jgi:hypothetical protein
VGMKERLVKVGDPSSSSEEGEPELVKPMAPWDLERVRWGERRGEGDRSRRPRR